MPSRVGVSYEIPGFTAGETITLSKLNQLCEALRVNRYEFFGIHNIWANPDYAGKGLGRYHRLQATDSFNDSIAGVRNGLNDADTKIYAGDIQGIINHLNWISQDFRNKGIGGTYGVGNPGAGEIITASKLQEISNNLWAISSNIDAYMGWYDGGNYCVRSCQVSCQAACQLACQNCNNSTCHVQNCGGWS